MRQIQPPAYKTPLPPNTSLCIYQDDDLIFSYKGKWLYPIFEFERFLTNYTGPRDNLSAHDTAVGKAAAVLLVRLDIKRIHANLASDAARTYLEQLETPIEFTWQTKIPRLSCATEELLRDQNDSDAIYQELRRRAKLL